MHSKTLFNDGWLFGEFPLLTPFEDMVHSELKPVELPHDWMIYHVNDLYKNSIGFYRKTFCASLSEASHFSLYFEGVYMNSHIFLNGNEICSRKYGYSSFEADMTDYLSEGVNELCVLCNYEAPNSRWYSGAGIYRNVYLIKKNDIRFSVFGPYVSTKKTAAGFYVSVDSEILSDSFEDVFVKYTVFSKKGGDETVSYTEKVSLNHGSNTVSSGFDVISPHLWDITDPYLYTFQAEIFMGENEKKDSFSCNLGFRTIRFDSNEGFFLNGRNVKINGVCQHHDLGALGAAINRAALKRQFDKLFKMGVNSVRTSHNMPAPELMELADETGMLIYSESFDMWELHKTEHDYAEFFPEFWKYDVENWVKRDRNHPSLIIWGIGNEIYDTHAGTGLKWAKLLHDAVLEYDPCKNGYTAIASNYIEWDNAQACSDIVDLSGYNYNERLYDNHHIKYPAWCIFGSETGSTVQSRGIYHFPLESRLLTHDDGQCSCLGNCTTNWGAKDVDSVVFNHRDRKFVFGQYVWTGWDYIGEPTPYFSKNSFFGQIDTAGFEKDTYYHYQAEWTDYRKSPMVHLLPYWDFNEGQIIDVCAYSNAPYVELFLNGESKGKQFIDHVHGTTLQGNWKIPYKKGEIKVLAYDETGKIIASDLQQSFSDPVSVVVKTNNHTINADGKDIAFIEISTVDENGTFVANARNRMNISVTGPGRLVGLDNGDSTDYEEYKCSSRKLFSGRLLAMVMSTNVPGMIEIHVSSKDLTGAVITVESIGIINNAQNDFYESNQISEEKQDISIRKINLVCSSTRKLSKDNPDIVVDYSILPNNATYKDITFKALTKDGVEANFVSVKNGCSSADIHAFGDGDFRLTAMANNGKNYPEVISELEFSVTGLGTASFNPYSLVPGIQYDSCHSDDCELSFFGGVFLPVPTNGMAFITYNNVDFGDYGSDEITIPIFSFQNELPIEVWAGNECLLKDTYRAKSIYNQYQANTFKLSRRIKNTTSLTLKFDTKECISIQGFFFKKYEKAYSKINALEYSELSGDKFSITDEAIESIGNNVTVTFSNMLFDKGLSGIEITGKSNMPVSSVHIVFNGKTSNSRQMVEIRSTSDYEIFRFPLNCPEDCNSVSFVFLPGSDFNFKDFCFLPRID